MKNIFDVSKYNSPILVILSIPFVVLGLLFLAISLTFASLAIVIGRRPIFKLFYKISTIIHE